MEPRHQGRGRYSLLALRSLRGRLQPAAVRASHTGTRPAAVSPSDQSRSLEQGVGKAAVLTSSDSPLWGVRSSPPGDGKGRAESPHGWGGWIKGPEHRPSLLHSQPPSSGWRETIRRTPPAGAGTLGHLSCWRVCHGPAGEPWRERVGPAWGPPTPAASGSTSLTGPLAWRWEFAVGRPCWLANVGLPAVNPMWACAVLCRPAVRSLGGFHPQVPVPPAPCSPSTHFISSATPSSH